MKYLLIGGAPSSGKTGTSHDIARMLIDDFNFDLLKGKIPDNRQWDFTVVLAGRNAMGEEIKIILNSPSDDLPRIRTLSNRLAEHPDTEILISTVRDGGDGMRWEFFDRLNIDEAGGNVVEVPLGKITRRNDWETPMRWYSDSLIQLIRHLLRRDPFNL